MNSPLLHSDFKAGPGSGRALPVARGLGPGRPAAGPTGWTVRLAGFSESGGHPLAGRHELELDSEAGVCLRVVAAFRVAQVALDMPVIASGVALAASLCGRSLRVRVRARAGVTVIQTQSAGPVLVLVDPPGW